MRVPFGFPRIPSLADLPKIFRQLENDMETVINVLQPGPLGIIEHKFSASELQDAKATVARAVENGTRNRAMENSHLTVIHEQKKDLTTNEGSS